MSQAAVPAAVPDPLPNDPPSLQWSPTNAIAYGWRAVWARFEIVGVVFVAGILGELPALAAAALEFASAAEEVTIGLRVAGLFVSVYFSMALTRYLLKVARGDPTGIGELFAGGPYWTVLLTTLLAALGILVGLVLLIVPGVIVALGWGQAVLLVVDGRAAGPVEALRASWRLTKGRKWGLLLLALLSVAVVLAGFVACIVGVLVAVPIVYVAGTYTYLMLTRQPLVRFGPGGPTNAGVS